MAKEYYYDTRSLSAATEQQFFHESRAKHPDKEIGTNMELDAKFPRKLVIKKVVCVLPTQVSSSSTAKDANLFAALLTLIKEGIIEIQAGTNPVKYLPLSYCLSRNAISGNVAYTLGTAADGSYGMASAQSVNGEYGLAVEIPVDTTESLKFYLKTKTAVTLANIRFILEVEVS